MRNADSHQSVTLQKMKAAAALLLLPALLLAVAVVGEQPCSFAFVASFYADAHSRRPFCGGSLVHRSWALSAAHCFAHLDREGRAAVRAQAGGGARRRALAVHAHPAFAARTLAHDIALVRLAAPFPAGWPYVPVGGRALSDVSYAMTIVTWAMAENRTESDGGGLPTLTCLRVWRIQREVCHRYVFKDVSIDVPLICVTSSRKGRRPCPGDSGGPLLSDDVLVGVTSFGLPCRVKGSPSAFTEVAAHLEWMQSVLELRGCRLSTVPENNDSNILYVLGAAAADSGNLLGGGFCLLFLVDMFASMVAFSLF